jgi:hypothetical protein
MRDASLSCRWASAFREPARPAICRPGLNVCPLGANNSCPALKSLRLTLVIGQYAQVFHLPGAGRSLTETVQNWRDHWPEVVPLPHSSPRNNIWMKRNPWFEKELLPALRSRVAAVLANES